MTTTGIEKEILVAIVEWKISHDGNSPTLDDLAKLVNRGKTSIRYHIQNMIADGLIRSDEHKAGFEVHGRWTPPLWYKETQRG